MLKSQNNRPTAHFPSQSNSTLACLDISSNYKANRNKLLAEGLAPLLLSGRQPAL
jgi:hypothetical protein